MMAPYRILFFDQGQDLLWLDCDVETGEILDCGPYHARLYASGKFFVDLTKLMSEPCVHLLSAEGLPLFAFRWPLEVLCQGDVVLRNVEVAHA